MLQDTGMKLFYSNRYLSKSNIFFFFLFVLVSSISYRALYEFSYHHVNTSIQIIKYQISEYYTKNMKKR